MSLDDCLVSNVCCIPEVQSEMLKEIYFVVHESPEGGYEAEALNHSIYTEADTLEELRQMVNDAVQCHFEPAAGYHRFLLWGCYQGS